MTTKAGEPFAPKVQINEGHKAVRGDCQREKQRRAERPEAPPKLAGQRIGQVTNSMVFPRDCSKEAESHFREIVTSAQQHLHVCWGADQLILFPRDTCEPDAVKIEEVILGTSKIPLAHKT